MIVCGFPGVGKTKLFETNSARVVDSDSSKWPRTKETWYENYVRSLIDTDSNRWLTLCSTHKPVRQELVKLGRPFVLVYPELGLKQEYMGRFIKRGNTKEFLELMDNRWDDFVAECERQTFCVHLVLKANQYLSDVIRIWI